MNIFVLQIEKQTKLQELLEEKETAQQMYLQKIQEVDEIVEVAKGM